MCARYTLTRSDLGAVARELAAEVDASAARIHLPRFNVGPAQTCLIVRRAGGVTVMSAAVWGLHVGGHPVVNLRSETAGRRQGLKRCVVPTDGFYEWTGAKGARRPIWFHRPGGELLLLGGLLDEAGEAAPTFAVLTARALPPVSEVHDRMPVVFGAEQAKSWLTKGGKPEVEPIELVATPVSTRVNAVANDDERLLDAEPQTQLRFG